MAETLRHRGGSPSGRFGHRRKFADSASAKDQLNVDLGRYRFIFLHFLSFLFVAILSQSTPYMMPTMKYCISGRFGHRRKFADSASAKDQLNVGFDGYNTSLSAVLGTFYLGRYRFIFLHFLSFLFVAILSQSTPYMMPTAKDQLNVGFDGYNTSLSASCTEYFGIIWLQKGSDAESANFRRWPNRPLGEPPRWRSVSAILCHGAS
jgi:hypothetical protein